MKIRKFISIVVPIVIILIIVGSAFSVGVIFGYKERSEVRQITGLINKDEDQPERVDFEPFWEAWRLIDERYVPNDDDEEPVSVITDQDKVWGAIDGLVNSLGDPYSVFLTPRENQLFREDVSGNFGGVGMEVGVRGGALTVVAPLKDSPAARVGIKAGDIILEIDGKTTMTMSIHEAITLIRGEPGTPVQIKVFREGGENPLSFSILRSEISIPTIESQMLPENIFLIRLFNFGALAPNLFREALREFVLSGSDKLVLDLRGNPGGYLEASIDMASWFLPLGKPVVIEERGREEKPKVYRSKGFDIFTDKLKLAILIDGGSASASEILAGALQEHGVAVLVGSQTFGKGSVQELLPLTDDTSLKITIARWLTPKGVSLSHQGLIPDIEINSDNADGDDKQLTAAIDYLLQI